MSDRYGVRAPRTATRDYSRPNRSQMTDYERELDPYFDTIMEEEVEQRRRIQPLRWILERLQTGQYISANVVDELIKAIQYNRGRGGDPLEQGDLLSAVVEGITGERKGSYENVIRDTLGRGTKKVFENAPEGKRRSQWDWADVLGFVGDIILDPMTYVSFGGASKGAQIAASTFADDAVKLMGRQIINQPEQLVKLTRNKWTREALEQGLSAKNPGKALRNIFGGNDDLGRLFDLTYREAYRKALNRTQNQLPGLMDELVEKGTGKPLGSLAMDEVVGRLSDDVYQKSGERFLGRFLGNEFGVGPANAFADARRRSWESFRNLFEKNPGVANVRNAVWGAMNRGPVGAVRQALGFRNPYQKYLRNLERETGEFAVTEAQIRIAREAFRPLDNMSEEEYGKVLNYMTTMQDVSKAVGPNKGGDMVATALKAGPAEEKKIVDAAYELKKTFEGWQDNMNKIAADFGERPLEYYEWYVPEVFRNRVSGVNPRKAREYTFSQQKAREASLFQAVFGIDEDLAKRIVNENLSGVSVDLKEMIASRALAQAKAESRHNMLLTFREFGLDLDEMAEAGGAAAKAAEGLRRGGIDVVPAGMRVIEHPAFMSEVPIYDAAGEIVDTRMVPKYLFDYDVADIIERALEVSGPKRNPIAKAFHAYMNWWKGMVLMTSGYTMRNFYSNTMTQFMRHGTRAFSKKEIEQSIAAVAYITQKTSPKNLSKALDSIGKDEGWLKAMLNSSVGGMTLRDAADDAFERGVISENLMAFSGKDIAEKMSGAASQPIRTGFRKLNTFVENVPRMQSYIIDVTDNGAAEATREWAARQARQWFIDYGDLSDFEQKVMKNVIPFYTFLRKNIANQLNGIALYPELYGLIGKVQDFTEYEDEGIAQEFIPEWMQNEGFFAIGKTEEGVYRMFRQDFAYQDLNLIPLVWKEDRFLPYLEFEELKNDIINATAPWIRDVASRMTTENGYNYFYRQELGEEGDAPYLFRLFASNPGVLGFVDGLARWFGSEDGAKLRIDDNGKLQMDAEMAQTLETYIPVLRQIEMLMYLPQTYIPGLEEAIEAATGAQDDYEGVEQGMQMMSYYLGIKTKEADLERERERLGWDVYYRARDVLNEARQQAPGYDLRSQRARDTTRESIRRLGG